MMVYIVERDGGAELDVYSSLADAEFAASLLGVEVIEQPLFAPSSEDERIRDFLDALREERS